MGRLTFDIENKNRGSRIFRMPLFASRTVFADADAPVDEATLKSQIDALSAGMTASLDGGKKAIAVREHQKEVVIKSLRQLGHYVEENCKDNMPTFLKSGLQPVSATIFPFLHGGFCPRLNS